MDKHLSPTIVQPDAGKDLHAFGNILSIMLGSDQTGGKLSIMSELTPPGGGPPLHVHSKEDEIFIVIEGRISYFVDGNWTEVEPGGVVYLPQGAAHCYRNIGNVPSRHWIIVTPSGFEQFFANCAYEFSNENTPNPERIVAIHREHGIELMDIPEDISTPASL